MVELRDQGTLAFSFPEVHPEAELRISFARTLRVPDDDKSYPLPPGLGTFPLRHVDDHTRSVPPEWLARGGVMMPMYQSEALWLHFASLRVPDHGNYPFALKVAAGKLNAVSGGAWTDALQQAPQDYMVVPTQPWLDGFSVGKGYVRQFVAMPLGRGYSVEEQLTGRAHIGGLQLIVYPMKRAVFEERFPYRREVVRRRCRQSADDATMGLAAGGKLQQQIFADPYGLEAWDSTHSRCFVHLVNSRWWLEFTGQLPPYPPITAQTYTEHGYPWFDYYRDDLPELAGSEPLAGVQSLAEVAAEKNEVLPDNESVEPTNVVTLLKKPVREGGF